MVQCWTVEQLVVLDKLAGALSVKELEAELARFGEPHTERSIVQQAATARISLRRRGRRPAWTDDEDAIVRAGTGRLTAQEIANDLRRLPGVLRSARAVRFRAAILGVDLRERRDSVGLRELQRILPVGVERVRQWVQDGYLRVDRESGGSSGRAWRFLTADIEAFIRDHTHLYDWQAMWPGRWRELAQFAARRATWLTVEQTARALGQSRSWVRERAARGEYPGAIKVGRGWRIPASALASMRELAA